MFNFIFRTFLEASNVYNLDLELNPKGNVCDTLSNDFLTSAHENDNNQLFLHSTPDARSSHDRLGKFMNAFCQYQFTCILQFS
jgi:hypothetical protein